MRAGMAAALARRVAAAALARGRGMCSAPAAAGRAAAALSSEELMRMERDCSAHKYVLSVRSCPLSKPIDLPGCVPAACLSKCLRASASRLARSCLGIGSQA